MLGELWYFELKALPDHVDASEVKPAIIVTEESNGYAVWFVTHNIMALLLYTFNKDKAIYEAVITYSGKHYNELIDMIREDQMIDFY